MNNIGLRKLTWNAGTIFIGILLINLILIPMIQDSNKADGFPSRNGPSSYISMDKDLVIDGDDDFDDYSHITGNGTEDDPYLISGLDMNEYSIIVKNTTSFFKISDIEWDSNYEYRIVCENNSYVNIENLTISSKRFFNGINCKDVRIMFSHFSTDEVNKAAILEDFNFLSIINSTFNMTGNNDYGEIQYITDNGTIEILNCYMNKFNIKSEVTGKHIVKNSTFMNSYLSPRKMSENSIIGNNFFKNGCLSIVNSYYIYNYGLIENNSFKDCYKALRVFGEYYLGDERLLIQRNQFNLCDYGIHCSDSSNMDITENIFTNNSVNAIYLIESDGFRIWRNTFINNGGNHVRVYPEDSSSYENDWNSLQVGNYWDNHISPDIDGNGIVDISFNISEKNKDKFPVTNINFDTEKPEIKFTSHSSGKIHRSYNRIKWETNDKFGIKEVMCNLSSSMLNLTGCERLSVFLEEGIYNISLKVTDRNGLFNYDFLELELERTYPVINFTTVSDGYYMDYHPVPVQWDIVEYFPVAKQNFTIDGKKTTLSNETRSINLDLEEGLHSISITLTDDLGFEITESVDFIVDRNAPSIQLRGLSPGSELSSRTVNFDCRILEIVGLNYVRYRFDEDDWVFEDENFSVERVLDQGSHVFRIEALDGAGHLSELEIPFEISTENLVEVLSPENGSVFNTDTIDLEWTYGGKFLWSEAFLRLGADKEFFSIGTSYEYEMDFPEDGEYLVTLRLVDEVGNYIQSNFWVIKDTEDPTVGFLDVEEINYINTWKFDLNWNAVDNNGIDYYELKVDEIDWDDRGLETSKEVGLTEGEHTITIRAYDLAGNMDEAQIYVIVDVTPPELEFDEMDVFTSTSIEIEWKANDLYGIENMYITIEDMKPNDVTDKDSYSVVLNQDGIFDVILNATDLAGNLETITTTIVVDTTEPRAIWEDTSIEITNETDLKLEWEIDEDVGIQSLYLTIDGNKIDLDENDTSYIADLEDGTHSISLTVIDIGGWQYTLNYPHDILVDSTPPTFQFDSKEIGTDGKAVIQWTVSDDGNDLIVMISVDGENFIEVPGTSYTTGVLPPGDHTIQLKITDSAGNQVDETWTFTIEEEKDQESGGSGGFIAVIIVILVVLIVVALVVVLIFLRKKKEKEPEEKESTKVTVPTGPPGIGLQKVDNSMLAA
ncbi:MAG: hypothetical protein GF411_13040, partial [Candidatus Lokiarchaeota archaeon]|nr:hypothetical protein [Candidatus Lokiarchaeota archaeon]